MKATASRPLRHSPTTATSGSRCNSRRMPLRAMGSSSTIRARSFFIVPPLWPGLRARRSGGLGAERDGQADAQPAFGEVLQEQAVLGAVELRQPLPGVGEADPARLAVGVRRPQAGAVVTHLQP